MICIVLIGWTLGHFYPHRPLRHALGLGVAGKLRLPGNLAFWERTAKTTKAKQSLVLVQPLDGGLGILLPLLTLNACIEDIESSLYS